MATILKRDYVQQFYGIVQRTLWSVALESARGWWRRKFRLETLAVRRQTSPNGVADTWQGRSSICMCTCVKIGIGEGKFNRKKTTYLDATLYTVYGCTCRIVYGELYEEYNYRSALYSRREGEKITLWRVCTLFICLTIVVQSFTCNV